MTAKEWIINDWGEEWLSKEWQAGDVIDALQQFAALISEGYVTKEKYMDDLCDEYQRGFEDGMDEARNTDRL